MDCIYYNGQIVTMEHPDEVYAAMLVSRDRIVMLGDNQEVLCRKTSSTNCIDLKGRTLLPGMIDAHGHFLMYALSHGLFLDATCGPEGTIHCMEDLLALLRQQAQHSSKQPIVAFGFDDTLIEEYRMPEAADLDQISTDRIIVVLHASIHMMSANTAAMKAAGVLDPAFQPEDGAVYRDETGKPTGIFEEAPAMEPFAKVLLSADLITRLPSVIGQSCQTYLSCGITTVCEGAGHNMMASLVHTAAKLGKFPARYIMCPSMGKKVPRRMNRKDPLKIIDGPVKLIQDGSIQCYTAHLSQPYAHQHPVRTKPEDYCGVSLMRAEVLQQKLEAIIAEGRSFAIHANGDGAVDVIIEALSGCKNLARAQERNLLIHSQTIREDQLDQLKALHLYPSFFPAHIYVWGDRHASTFLGPERAARISPCASALKRGLPFSLHNDPPVTRPNPLGLVWDAVSRKTASGQVLGADQAISVYEALRAVTIDAAWQYGLDNLLGSLAPGKKADFILLDKNPLRCPAEELPEIQVQRVWIDGKMVWNFC